MEILSKLCVILMASFTVTSGRSTRQLDWVTQVTSYMDPIPEGLGEICRGHVLEYLQELKHLETWAVSMMDASSKFPSGAFSGNIRLLGNFDQCVRLRHPEGKHHGKYCLLKLEFSTFGENLEHLEKLIDIVTASRRPLEIGEDWLEGTHVLPIYSFGEYALCLPSTCSSEDARKLGLVAISRMTSDTGMNITVMLDDSRCYTRSSGRPLEILDFFVIAIFLALVLVILTSTIYFYVAGAEKMKSPVSRFCSSFSLLENWRRLVDLEVQPRDSITCLDGVRSLSTIWVVMTHQFVLISQSPYANKMETFRTHNNYVYYLLWNSYFNVDTFLLVSGLLRSYNVMKDLGKDRFRIFWSCVQRYMRLTPAYLFVILFYMTIFERLDSGPAWNYYVTRNSEACRQYWWQNLLYINNYASHNYKCMLQSWYLSADMQLFLAAPFLVYPLWRWRFFGKLLSAFLMVLSVLSQFLTVYLYELPGTYVPSVRNSVLNEYCHRVYMATHNRSSPYIIGIFLGSILYGSKNVTMSKLKVIFGWTLSLATMYTCIYGAMEITSVGHTYNVWESAIYGGFHRFVWACAVAWLIYACHTGYGGAIDRFLSCTLFRYSGRLSYSVYLTHLALLLYHVGVLQIPRQLHMYITIREFTGDFVFIFFTSLVLYLCVELPFFNLTRHAFR
ncbi:nose resistant to fluoxetine protein 6 [Orussus abietinus]|uniref:nose resistant to fluoxetine protein 6 n=1 Tax=Orussus abietinus TaxID=222816 RepID=UPI00062658D5|nr:nose resistant to fluoxetine protein 6 [Orussus abietinus]XP_012280076.1 nose resistant to fluoxetine protein 6 [Orussus abietinus]XP_012280077.1 nose resistant to fluoxetine protein 6 [Orussus abietinus]